MHFTVAALVEFSTKKGKKTSEEGHFFDCMNQTKQQVSSRTCHPENIRPDMALKETANDSMD
jgi:hypothetical protein